MEITITINGKPVKATVDDAAVKEAMGKKQEKKTGYERNRSGSYCFASSYDDKEYDTDTESRCGNARYEVGNYYSSEEVAENNIRADKLMRNLRRFAAEHGGCGKPSVASYIPSKGFDSTIKCINGHVSVDRGAIATVGGIYFKDIETADAAIKAFHDELMWYFTEYDPMPKGWWNE